MKTFNETSMIKINIGDKIMESSRCRTVVVKHISLVPNGTSYTSKTLIAIIAADIIDNNGVKQGRVIATADKFEPLPGELYEEEFPSSLLDKN